MSASLAAAKRLPGQFAWEIESARRAGLSRAAAIVDELPRVHNETAHSALKRAVEAIRAAATAPTRP